MLVFSPKIRHLIHLKDRKWPGVCSFQYNTRGVEWWGGGSVHFILSVCSFVYFVLSLSVAKLITFLFVLFNVLRECLFRISL